MKDVHAGAASTPPCALFLIFRGLSIPIHTPATRSEVYPMYQTSVPSFVVPVLPPAGIVNWLPTEPAAVPRCTTSFIMLTTSHASSGVITGVRAGVGSQ